MWDYLWIIVPFFYQLLNSQSDGTHSLQRINLWGSTVMPNFSKSVLIKKQTYVHLWWPEMKYIFSKLSFLDERYLQVKKLTSCIDYMCVSDGEHGRGRRSVFDLCGAACGTCSLPALSTWTGQIHDLYQWKNRAAHQCRHAAVFTLNATFKCHFAFVSFLQSSQLWITQICTGFVCFILVRLICMYLP